MAANPVMSFLRGGWRPQPWPVLLTGLGITALGLPLLLVGDAGAPFRFVVFLAGLITTGAGVSLRLRTAGQQFEERMESAGVLAVAAFAALLAFLGTDAAWDSMQMVLAAMIAMALAGIVLVLLPTPARMIAVGLLVLLHFGGIITAATTIEPAGASAPWVAQELWVRFYRPYLQFMYLNNAYHFYSPEPGPPSLLWFHIKYADGSVKWIKVPNRDEDPVPIHHTRLLSITESTASLYTQPYADPQVLLEIRQDRTFLGEQLGIPVAPDYIMPSGSQEQEAQPFSQKMLESYVRHVARLYEIPGNPIKGIKVYRFRQVILNTEPMASGRNPLDPTQFVGFYQGEYDKDGALRYPDVYDDNGKLLERKDPFRFWYMPIYRRPKNHKAMRPDMTLDDLELVDELTQHARLNFDTKKIETASGGNDSPWADGPETPK